MPFAVKWVFKGKNHCTDCHCFNPQSWTASSTCTLSFAQLNYFSEKKLNQEILKCKISAPDVSIKLFA